MHLAQRNEWGCIENHCEKNEEKKFEEYHELRIITCVLSDILDTSWIEVTPLPPPPPKRKKGGGGGS